MFYAHFVLAKKGPLAKVWLAAHWDKKITKSHVFETDVEKTVDDIISPKVKMALRTSGHLLLGVVRIYSMKQKYLIQDLGEACAKIKMAFRPGAVDLPSDAIKRTNTDAITLPEIFNDFEAAVVDIGSLDMDAFKGNQAAIEDITLPPEVSTRPSMFSLEDDDFGPIHGDAGDMLEDIPLPRALHRALEESADRPDGPEGSRMEDDSHIAPNDKEDQRHDAVEQQPVQQGENVTNMSDVTMPTIPSFSEERMEVDGQPQEGNVQQQDVAEAMEVGPIPVAEQPTLTEENGYILEPIDTTTSVAVKVRHKRKRKLIIDSRKELTSDFIRRQLKDPSDTLRPRCFPPPTKKYLRWRETSTVEQLLQRPTMPGLSKEAAAIFTSNYTHTTDGGGAELELRQELEEEEEEMREDVIPLNINLDEPLPDNMATVAADGAAPIEPQPEIGEENATTIDEPTLIDQQPQAENEEVPQENEVPPEVMEEEKDGSEPLEEQESATQGKKWSKRTEQMVGMLDKGFSGSDSLLFSDLSRKCGRKQAASRFYSLLLLAKDGMVKFNQDEPYGEITITKGAYYDS